MTRAAIYTRVSTEDQAKEGFSLEAQQERLEAYCAARGWGVGGVYVDEGHSGRTIERPAYTRMMLDRLRWDVLLILKMDRIHRNSRNFMDMMERLLEWDKEFVSVQENFDTSTAMGRFVMDIIQRIAQLESEQIGERVYMGMSQKAKGGHGALGSPFPYGYSIVDGQYVVEPREAGMVREIFRRRVAGESLNEIAKRLEARRIPTKHGRPWRKQTIAAILANPLYRGQVAWDAIVTTGSHEPLVSEDIFEKAKRRSAHRRLSATRVHAAASASA